MKRICDFSIGEYPITKIQWDAVALWAKNNGYNDLTSGSGYGNKPVGCVNWYNAIKFCNALSELAGLIPVYMDNHHEVYKNGRLDINVSNIKQDANGYRLPTSKEWEFACRAGSNTKYFWGDNFDANIGPVYAWYTIGNFADQSTKEVGSVQPNAFGLYDMSGNVFEWCFDSYMDIIRVMRGGSIALDSILESRHVSYCYPDYECYETGFRVASSNAEIPSVGEAVKKSFSYGEHIKKEADYPDMSTKAVALRLYENLGETKDAIEIKKIIESGNYDSALLTFKELFIETFKKRNFVDFIKFNAYKDIRFQDTIEKLMDSDFNSPWYGKSNECILRHDGAPLLCLAIKYYETKETKYLNKFFELVNSFLVRHKAEYDILDEEMLNQKQTSPQSWAWFMGFDSCMRMNNLIRAMWCVIFTCENTETIPSGVLTQFAISMMSDHMFTMIKDGRERVPNQRMYVIAGLFILSDIFCDFKTSKSAKKIATKRFEDAFESVMYPDGTCIEQAFNYNNSMIVEYTHLKSMLREKDVLHDAYKYVTKLSRMLSTTCTPTGATPPIGTVGGLFPPDLYDMEMCEKYKSKVLSQSMESYGSISWVDWERIMDCVLHGSEDAPKFTSVFFPYNSQAVIRDRFDIFSRYMFFYAPRKGLGHACENVNDIYVAAFGRPMLVNAGAHSYGMKYHCVESQYDFIEQIDKYQYSSFGRNTICVDNSSQSRLKKGEACISEKYDCTSGNKWHQSDDFIYVEGKYEDGYYACDDVCHHREIFYDRKTKLFFVLDTLHGEMSHDFTQIWGFMPQDVEMENGDGSFKWKAAGYADDMIFTGKNCIYTRDMNGPNIFLYQFSNEEISYSRKRGELDPARGWFAPKIAGRRYPKTDVYAKWKSGKNISAVLTVIETVPTEKSEIANLMKISNEELCGCKLILKSGDEVSFYFGTETGNIKMDHRELSARAALVRNDRGVVIGSAVEPYTDYEFKNGDFKCHCEIKAPKDMHWKEEDGYSHVTYEY